MDTFVLGALRRGEETVAVAQYVSTWGHEGGIGLVFEYAEHPVGRGFVGLQLGNLFEHEDLEWLEWSAAIGVEGGRGNTTLGLRAGLGARWRISDPWLLRPVVQQQYGVAQRGALLDGLSLSFLHSPR